MSLCDCASQGEVMYKQNMLAAFIVASIAVALNAQPARGYYREMPEELLEGSEEARAVARLGDLSPVSVRERLKQMRAPAFQPTSNQIKKAIESQDMPIANFKRIDRLKSALQPVLDYHERSRMQVYVLDSNLPKTILIGRLVIFITTRMRRIASDQEIRGIVAHELAHEYIWDELFDAQREKDWKLMRECELFCDVVAAFTLKEIGDDPASYGRILERMTIIGSIEGSTTVKESRTHPSLEARLKLNKFLCRKFSS